MEIGAVFTVFGWAFLSFWSAIPGGFALSLPPLVTVITAVISYGAGALLVVVVGEPLQHRIRRHLAGRSRATPDEAAGGAVKAAWERYGLIGLAALSPMTVGSLGGAAIGIALGIPPGRLVAMLTLGAAVWGVVIGTAVALGVMSADALLA
jgi:hypothetical protein